MQEPSPKALRKPGRPRTGLQVNPFTIMLPPHLHEWAMQQPEGISLMVRQLLTDEYTKRQSLLVLQEKNKETRILLGTDLEAKRVLLRAFLGLNITRLVCLECGPSPSRWRYTMFLDGHVKGEVIGRHKDFIRRITWERLSFECGNHRGEAIHHADRKTWHMYRDVLIAIAEHEKLPEGWDGRYATYTPRVDGILQTPYIGK